MTLPRRILMTADAVGGVWTYALDLAAELAAGGVATNLAVLGPPPDADRQRAAAAVPGLALTCLPYPLDWLARNRGEIAEGAQALACLAAGTELVHLNAPAFAGLARFPVPVVAVSHSCMATWWAAVQGTAMPKDVAWRAALHGEGLAAATRIVAPSAAFARATTAAHRLPRMPRVVRNGRAPATVVADAAPDCVFTAGRLWDQGKDLATLGRAAARLAVPVIAAGATEGPDGNAISLPHLHLLGPVSPGAIAGWLARRPVFVSMARYEPFGLTVLEAAQAGCPLVLADTPVFRELWHGAARFVPPGDDLALAALLHDLVSDREQRGVLGSAAARRARRYSVAAMTQGMLAVYRDALTAPRLEVAA